MVSSGAPLSSPASSLEEDEADRRRLGVNRWLIPNKGESMSCKCQSHSLHYFHAPSLSTKVIIYIHVKHKEETSICLSVRQHC